MEAYERWFAGEGEMGERLLAVLHLLGLFDRPAAADLLAVLRRPPAIEGLTDALAGVSDSQWNLAVSRLAESGLMTPDGGDLDAHPLVREHFGRRLRERSPDAWRAAHGRLFDHLKDNTEHRPDTLEGLQPLYQAVVHGCQAGRQKEACYDVYLDRISRGAERYVANKLGAFGADLGAVACFFDPPWTRVSTSLPETTQALLLHQAAFRLRALGRFTEAGDPMRAALEMGINQKDWGVASRAASNLSELELTLGDIASAVRYAAQASVHANRDLDDDLFQRVVARTSLADAICQAGRREEALALLQEAEAMQAERQPQYPILYSLRGFQYCDLLLSGAERAAGGGRADRAAGDACDEAERRAAQTLEWVAPQIWILDIALDHLTLGRARLYRAILGGSTPGAAEPEIGKAVDGLRRAGIQQMLPLGLLTRAWLRSTQGRPEDARADLAEAQEIAKRGPMPLHLADIHLYRARLFHDRAALAEARRLVEKHGYGRRREEVEDLEKAADGW